MVLRQVQGTIAILANSIESDAQKVSDFVV